MKKYLYLFPKAALTKSKAPPSLLYRAANSVIAPIILFDIILY